MTRTYVSPGSAWLVCPVALALDPRYADHPDRWPDCRKGQPCIVEHDHEPQIAETGGHKFINFRWSEGSNHADDHPVELRCKCGRQLVYGDLDNPWSAETVSAE